MPTRSWQIGRLGFLVFATALVFAPLAAAQPAIPISELPKNVPADVAERIKALYSPLPGERIAAIIRLGDLGEKATPAIPFLLALWDDAEPATMKTTVSGGLTLESTEYPRWQAVKAFGRIGKPAVEPLITALHADNEMVRRLAAQGLGAIKDARAVESLVRAAQEPNYVGVDSIESLRKITGQNLATGAAWLKWWEEKKSKTSGQ